ncbi:Aste57867_5834 [Aphanomyces stellatus]|uniref:Aste57867_5834 protein n=1 Tax=Aphanomyces stellatus TaxID=120398 RepID=A0A485KF22_9STRA|nr:hypothetical protein As57867_005820 [Aphanomyces stellatus]VFT82857.1 Aste57867_5834 [Aphanomyces stellatus]
MITHPSPFSPTCTSPLRIAEPTSHLRLTPLQKAQLLDVAQNAADRLLDDVVSSSFLDSVVHKATVLTEYSSLDAYCAHVHPYGFNGFHASATLYATHTHTCDAATSAAVSATITVKWSVVNNLWTHDRDFCYVEIQKPIMTATGRRGYLRCLHSIPLFIVSSKKRHLRATLAHSGVVVLETDVRGQLEETMLMRLEPHGRMPQWVAAFMARRLIHRAQTEPYHVSNEPSLFGGRRASVQPPSVTPARRLSSFHPPAASMRGSLDNNYPRASLRDIESQCKVCTTRLKWYRPRVKCKVCHAWACKSCSTHCDVLLKESDRACLLCNEHLALILAKSEPQDEEPEDTLIYVDEWDDHSL